MKSNKSFFVACKAIHSAVTAAPVPGASTPIVGAAKVRVEVTVLTDGGRTASRSLLVGGTVKGETPSAFLTAFRNLRAQADAKRVTRLRNGETLGKVHFVFSN
jgi:hypothetical protein